MHYANGRPANNGDIIFQIMNSSKPVIGLLYDATAGNDYCNGMLAPLAGGQHIGACLKDCLHIDDVYAALGVNPKGDIRTQLSKVPLKV